MRALNALIVAPLGSVPVAIAYAVGSAVFSPWSVDVARFATATAGACLYAVATACALTWTCWPLAVLLRRLGADGPAAFALTAAVGIAAFQLLVRPLRFGAPMMIGHLGWFVSTAAAAGAACAWIFWRITRPAPLAPPPSA